MVAQCIPAKHLECSECGGNVERAVQEVIEEVRKESAKMKITYPYETKCLLADLGEQVYKKARRR